jgi:hypothetical protein
MNRRQVLRRKWREYNQAQERLGFQPIPWSMWETAMDIPEPKDLMRFGSGQS